MAEKVDFTSDEISLRPEGQLFTKRPTRPNKGGQAYSREPTGRRTTSTDIIKTFRDTVTSTPVSSHSQIPRSTGGTLSPSPILPVGQGAMAYMPGNSAHMGVDPKIGSPGLEVQSARQPGQDIPSLGEKQKPVFEQDASSSSDDAEEVEDEKEDNLKVRKILKKLNKEIRNNSKLAFEDQDENLDIDYDEDDCIIEYENIDRHAKSIKNEILAGDDQREINEAEARIRDWQRKKHAKRLKRKLEKIKKQGKKLKKPGKNRKEKINEKGRKALSRIPRKK